MTLSSQIISREMAQDIELRAIQQGDLLVWTVTKDPIDLPYRYVIRPHSTKQRRPLECALVANTLEAVRAQLPWGLTRLPRDTGDDPVIVETWV